jgi:Cu(I)/Ag(I) efflux system membrane fusion protein
MNDRQDPSAHRPPRGVRTMNAVRWALLAGLVVLAMVSVALYVTSEWRGPGRDAVQARAAWHCPMHPTYTSDRPGECPICGMALTPVGGAVAAGGDALPRGDVPGLTGVHLSPERIQLIGVRTAVVTRPPLGGQADLVGFVTPDESRLRRVQLRVAGWVRRLAVDQTGVRVARGQPLLTIYSPLLFQSEQEYLIERAVGHDGGGHEGGGAGAAAQRLRLLGVPEEEIRRLERERVASSEIVLRSPAHGTVLERSVLEGQYVGPDTPLLTVADLSRVWVLADLYEMDLARVRVGDVARFTADALPGRSWSGRVELIDPTVSSRTRTLQVRLSVDNRDGALRPGMYGRVRVVVRGEPGLSVPDEAVVRAGEHEYVFLARAGGRFEPRMVWTGRAEGDRVQVLGGLAEGDTVVASASFLIDSESRLEAAIAGLGAPGGPAAGHEHGVAP